MGDHPVKVPPILVGEWLTEAGKLGLLIPANLHHLANRAAQWGADQELEACCEYLQSEIGPLEAAHFRAARRPNSPSLKQQALAALEPIERTAAAPVPTNKESLLLIRRALEAQQ